MKRTNFLAVFVLVIELVLRSTVVSAQASAPAVGGAVQPPGFRAGGINAVITTASLGQRGLVVQLIVQNTRPNPIYISPITAGGVGAGATSSTGTLYEISDNGNAVTGIGNCNSNRNQINESVSQCVKGFPLENMTFLEPNQSTVLAITYRNMQGGPEDTGDNVSFVLKFLVRTAPKDADQLAVAADKVPPAGPSSVVTISFPLVPINTKGR